MSWNNKEEIETTCTVEQGRTILHLTKYVIYFRNLFEYVARMEQTNNAQL
jgi:hypothetical protein